ncbi:MAG: glycosyltransferase family 4 protein [Nitrospiraceae bacterium]
MQHILVLINNSGIGGAERRLGRLFARMVREQSNVRLIVNEGLWAKLRVAGIVSGYQAGVLVFREPFACVARGIEALNQMVALWVRKLDYLLMALWLWGRYCLVRPVLFHLVLGGTYLALPLVLARPGHRYIVSVTDPNLANLVGNRVGLWLYQFALKRASVIDALTDAIRDGLIRCGIDRSKIMVSPGSVVDATRFRPDRKKELWVIFAGRLIEEKNPLMFIEAVPAIRDAVPESRFFIFGQGPLMPQIRACINRLGLDAVITTGFETDLAPRLAKATVFVSLQRQDNYPSQSLLEAMACEMATVATDVGLTGQLVDESTGIRVKPDPVQIGGAVTELLKNPERCRQMGAMARQRVLARHSEEQYQTYLDRVYQLARQGCQATPVR